MTMLQKSFSILMIVSLTVSCSTGHPATSVVYQDYRIEKGAKTDSSFIRFLEPYATSLNASMNQVIGFSNDNLSAKQPESALGNLMADCMKEMAEKKFMVKVDAGFMNQGGIRSYIPKGNITVGKIFELMPFDNLVVLQKLNGAVLQAFLDKAAADGGWPVSKGITMKIKDKKAIAVMINGKPLEANASYTIANSDYIANGGSDCDMLRGIPQSSKGYLLRDALIEYVKDQTKQGKPLEDKIENRVINVN
jgi:2',3'-cyclic-nucleotide 2'-phosphodiesterase (5'-nucleotidase family)